MKRNDAFDSFCYAVASLMVDRRQVRFPRSKKRRIRRKWAKQPKNYRCFPKIIAYRIGNMIVMHPQLKEQMIRDMQVSGRARLARRIIADAADLTTELAVSVMPWNFTAPRSYSTRAAFDGGPIVMPQPLLNSLRGGV